MAECACGCRERTAGGTFRPGHDQKLRGDLEDRVGGLLALAKLVEAAEGFVGGRLSQEELASRIRTSVRTRRPAV
jgi:hypothetical protein